MVLDQCFSARFHDYDFCRFISVFVPATLSRFDPLYSKPREGGLTAYGGMLRVDGVGACLRRLGQ